MNRHALRALEFERVLDAVAKGASSPLGTEAVLERRPTADPAAVASELARLDEMLGWLIRNEDWGPPHIPDLRQPLRRLALEGSVWSEGDLVGALRMLRSAREVRRSILRKGRDFERLVAIAEGLLKDEDLQDRLEAALDEEAEALKDSATPELRRLRRDLRSKRTEIISHLESLMGGLPDRIAVPDSSVTVRGGRYCIPIRREGRSEVGGIVHDESASRATLFVEPPSAIEMMNLLRELESAEAREVERILRDLTSRLRPRHAELDDTLDRLIDLDSLFARARHGLRRGYARPVLVDRHERGCRIVQGRHPLLDEGPEPAVPFDLLLHPGEHTILVTGPNAGGKTVLLKTLGLIAALTQAGFLPPVGAGTELPVFGDIFADIGDEQSIDASLSTFSAHLRNLREILEHADEAALCLIDEIGGATDPVEGTALARAVLLELTSRGALTVATSHLGGLKTLPGERPGIVSAGLEFDAERLAPLYRLVKGRPGRSYGLAMARRAGLPDRVLTEAESFLGEDEAATSRLLSDLESQERDLDERVADLDARDRRIGEREAELERELAEARARAAEVEREAHRKAREFVLEARSRLDEALRADRADSREAREARRALEAQLRTHSDALQDERGDENGTGTEEVERFEPGDEVWLAELERTGRVLERRGADLVVEVGGIKMHVEPRDLERRSDDPDAKRRVETARGVAPELDVRSEIDLRGQIADEAELELLRAVDAAVHAGLSHLRVIHGKGTGVLRETVARFAREDSRVRSHRLGAPHEGGSGVTLLELET